MKIDTISWGVILYGFIAACNVFKVPLVQAEETLLQPTNDSSEGNGEVVFPSERLMDSMDAAFNDKAGSESQKFFFLQNDFHIRFNKSSVFFTLFTLDCQFGQKIIIGKSIINKTCFNPENDLKILIHGYTELGHSINSMIPMRQAYFRMKQNYNVLMTDWSLHSVDPNYYNSASHLDEIGKYVATFLLFVKQTTAFTNMTKVHLVGFSLGAHVAGIAGRYTFKLTGQKIGRITGLDPAGPKFHLALPHERIRLDDADFLDFIHGDTDTFGGNFLGHANFYPNGGRRQPGCLTLIEHYIGCGHRKTPQWFSESILTPRKFIGCRCSDYESYLEKKCTCANRNNLAVMGESCNINTRGNFYLVVRRGDYQYELGIYPNLISFGFTSTGTINNVTVPTIPLEQYMPMIPHVNYSAVDTAIPDRR